MIQRFGRRQSIGPEYQGNADTLRRIALIAVLVAIIGSFAFAAESAAKSQVVEPRLIPLRNGDVREWSDFPEASPGGKVEILFDGIRNTSEHALMLRQQNVKQAWIVTLNEQRLGELVRDENDMTIGYAIPPELLKTGENRLAIASPSAAKSPVDDIRVGQIRWHQKPLSEVLQESTLAVTVNERGTRKSVPCRITLIDANGSLVSLGTQSTSQLAIRPGTAYCSTGQAELKLPAGRYTLFAGRGFEYSLARADVDVKAGQTHRQSLEIQREVPTTGYVACDPHVHTLTHSGHGDASIEERVITLAAEGIELPIATDHNVQIDFDPVAQKMGVRRHFTPVIGNEVTTARGHFNIFPVSPGAKPPNHKQTNWGLLFDDIQKTPGVKIAILNHARDLHSGVRPFGPALHNALIGENLDGWPFRFQGMEVVNSGATQTDELRLFHDWMGLLNHGYQVTPVGSSDSHDVARHFVGQGRTYLRCDDRDPGQLDVDAAVDSFLQGRVMVSYGLLAELIVNEKYASGELAEAPPSDVQIDLRVLGPHWVQADRIRLYANGKLLREEAIIADASVVRPHGVLWSGRWTIPRPNHDVHLVAIATGPGIEGLFWRTARPYQPTSTDPATHVIGCSGAVWLDADGDGRRTSARDYAVRLMSDHPDYIHLCSRLGDYDEATSAQAAHLVRMSGVSLQDEKLQAAIRQASNVVQTGFRSYEEAWRDNEIARASR